MIIFHTLAPISESVIILLTAPFSKKLSAYPPLETPNVPYIMIVSLGLAWIFFFG